MADKKCPNCKRWNSESAMLCDCGYEFAKQESRSLKVSLTIPKGAVSPILVAVVNALPPFFGIGYFFIHDAKRFWLVCLLLQLGVSAVLESIGFSKYIGFYLSVLWIGIIIDGYRRAKAYNKRIVDSLRVSQAAKQELAETK